MEGFSTPPPPPILLGNDTWAIGVGFGKSCFQSTWFNYMEDARSSSLQLSMGIAILLQNPALPSLTSLWVKVVFTDVPAPRVPWLFPADWDGAPLPALQFRQLAGDSEVRNMKGVGCWVLGGRSLHLFTRDHFASGGACLRSRQCLDLRGNPNNLVIVFLFYSFKRSTFLIWILHTFHSKIKPWRSLHVPTQIIYVRADLPDHQGATLKKSKQEFTPRKAQRFKYLYLEASAFRSHTNLFSSKGNFYKRIHEVFFICIASKYFLYRLWEGIIHWKVTCHTAEITLDFLKKDRNHSAKLKFFSYTWKQLQQELF